MAQQHSQQLNREQAIIPIIIIKTGIISVSFIPRLPSSFVHGYLDTGRAFLAFPAAFGRHYQLIPANMQTRAFQVSIGIPSSYFFPRSHILNMSNGRQGARVTIYQDTVFHYSHWIISKKFIYLLSHVHHLGNH